MSLEVLRDAFDSSVRYVSIAPSATIANDVYLGNFVTIYPLVHVGSGCVIMDGAVLGRIPIGNRTVTRVVHSEFSEVMIEKETIIGSNAVIYTGTHIGKRAMIGDLSSIREGALIGDDVVIGRGVMLLYNCHVGARSRIQDQAHLVGNMVIEEDVFIGMGVTTTNDNDVYITRFGRVKSVLKGPTLRRFAVVGAGATLLPDVEIGIGALVGAGAVVTKDVPAWTIAAGVPAHYVRDISPEWRAQVEAEWK
jgi:acetyltransferase-like isoleucine patch superfamily enzyme